MSITAKFVVSQGADKTKFLLSDATPYDNAEPRAGFTGRQLIIYKSDGSAYRLPGATTDTINFSYGTYPDDEIEITGLEKDQAFSIIMTLTPASPVPGSIYSTTSKFALTGYVTAALLDRMKRQSLQPRLEHNEAFVMDTHRLMLESDNAKKAAAAGDIASAQLSLNRAAYIINYKIPY